MTTERKDQLIGIGFVLVVLFALGYLHFSGQARDRQRDQVRKEENCRTGHDNRRLERHYIVKDYRKFVRENQARFLNDPDNTLLREVQESTRERLSVRESNQRLPRYCKAHYVPEDERGWPPELRTEPGT